MYQNKGIENEDEPAHEWRDDVFDLLSSLEPSLTQQCTEDTSACLQSIFTGVPSIIIYLLLYKRIGMEIKRKNKRKVERKNLKMK